MKRILFFICLIFFISHLSANRRCEGPCLRPLPGPDLAYDFSKPFNEKRYWVERNSRTGEWQISWQRLGINPEFFESTTIFSFPAQPTDIRPDGAPKNGRCWKGDGVIVCEDETGHITVYHQKR